MKGPVRATWMGQWSGQYDATDGGEYGIIPILVGLAVVAGGGGYMAHESRKTAMERTSTLDMWKMLNAERAKAQAKEGLDNYRQESVQTAFLNAPATVAEADLMGAFWLYRAARVALNQVGFTAQYDPLMNYAETHRALGWFQANPENFLEMNADYLTRESGSAIGHEAWFRKKHGRNPHSADNSVDNQVPMSSAGLQKVTSIFDYVSATIGDVSLGMRVAVQDLANPRAIEQRRYLSQTYGNPKWMELQWAKETGRDLTKFAKNPLGASGIPDLKALWEQYKWWIIGSAGLLVTLKVGASAAKRKRARARKRKEARPAVRSAPVGPSLSEIRGAS